MSDRLESYDCIFVGAGAIGLPRLFVASGIGPGGHLQDLGLKVLHNLSGVGQDLQNHFQFRAIYKKRDSITLNDQLRSRFKKVLMGLEYALFRSDPVAIGASRVGIFAKTSKGLETPDIHYHVQPRSADSAGEGTDRFSSCTMPVCQPRPESRGWISLKPPDTKDASAIESNYLLTETDRRVAGDSIKFTRRLIRSPRQDARAA